MLVMIEDLTDDKGHYDALNERLDVLMMSAEGDELDAEMCGAWERCAAPNLRDVLRREYDEMLKGRPCNVALGKWGPECEEMIERDQERLANGS
jgi:hypothetical protein